MSGLLLLLGAISLLGPCSVDMYLPALPSIAADLHASAAAVQLTLPAFFVGIALSQIAFGTLADHAGRRPALLLGLSLFGLASVACALAQSASALTFWRVVQALGVGSTTVIPRTVVRDRFPVEHTARALSMLSLISGLGPILAPQAGGVLLMFATWRLLFWVLAGAALLFVPLVAFTLDESMPAERPHALGPRLWISLLTDRRYLRFALPANLIQSSVFAYIAGAPFVFIKIYELSPQQFAVSFGANAVALMAGSRVNAHLVTRLGSEYIFRRAMVGTAALGMLLIAVASTGFGGLMGFAVCLFLYVFSIGFNFANGFALALAPFGRSAGTASALYGMMQFLFAALAGAVVSEFYDGTPRPMAGVMGALALSAVALYRYLEPPAPQTLPVPP
jgi:DHA1 family bicyclomycin/chloramphenicol resistance-like MFS transporter